MSGTMKQVRELTAELEATRKVTALLLERLGGVAEIVLDEFGTLQGVAIATDKGQMSDGREVMRLRLVRPAAPLVVSAGDLAADEIRKLNGH